ncbi:MAG: neocarzinostatin apoprotein domain-containing protein [Halioglobus sp.]
MKLLLSSSGLNYAQQQGNSTGKAKRMIRRPACALRSVMLCCAVMAITACSDGSDRMPILERYPVSILETVFVDDTRTTPATGEFPALATRTLETTVFMPEGAGKFPLLFFSHGLGATPGVYASLIEEVAAAGFIVVAPVFPLTNTNAPAGPDASDTQQQPGDISFLIDAVTAAATKQEAPFDVRIDLENIGTFGHSNGGITTLGVIANSCCRDPRIDAAVSLSAPAAPYNNGEFDFSTSVPLMLVHGTLDVLVPYEESVRVFNQVEMAKGIVTLNEVGHSGFVVPTGPGFDTTANTIVDFFRAHLQKNSAAAQRLQAELVYDTEAEFKYAETGGTEVTLPLPPAITNRVAAVEPSTNLTHGQMVTVSWRNYAPGKVVNVLQCSEGGTGGSDVCDFSNASLFHPNPTGDGSLLLEIIIGKVGSGRCDTATEDCVIAVNDGGLVSEDAIIRIPISFAP